MSLFKDGLLIDVNVSRWSGAKILTAEDLGLKEENVAEAYKLGRKMLVPDKIIRQFRALEGRARNVITFNSFKYPIGNARFIPKKRLLKVHETLKALQVEFMAKVDELVENYNKYRTEMIPIYTQAAEIAFLTQEPSEGMFNIEDREAQKKEYIDQFLVRIKAHYPDANTLRSKFALEWDVYETALPKMRKGSIHDIIDQEEKKSIAVEEYRAQAKQKIGSFIEGVVGTLRQETIDLCNRVVANIKEGKVVKGKTLICLRDFIDNFSELNFVGDVKIEEELAKLKKDFLDTPVDKNEKVEDIQEELKKRLDSIIKVASETTDVNSVTGEYKRKISWE